MVEYLMARMAPTAAYYALRYRILERDNFTCRYCGTPAPEARLEVDHVVPVAAGGTDEEDNLVTSCYSCNRGKGDLLRVRAGLVQTKAKKKNLFEKIWDALEEPKDSYAIAELLGCGQKTVDTTLRKHPLHFTTVEVNGMKGKGRPRTIWARVTA